MIIFQGHPSRLYPLVLDNILSNTNFTNEEFHYPFLVKRRLDVINTNNILDGITRFDKHERSNDFLYGVFSSCHLNLHDEDFVFTLLNNPVDQIYEAFAYYSFCRDNINKLSSNAAQQSKVINQIPQIYLEEFIDLILDDSEFVFNYRGINYYPIKEAIYGFDNFDHFNYIGKYSHVNHLFHILNIKFNLNIPFIKKETLYSFKGEKYKLDILNKKFKKQIDFYNKLNNIYKYNTYI
jgi:hypothetical protein